MDAVADQLLKLLRQLAPHKVRVYDGSDDARDVAVPQRRKRWDQVIRTIEAKPWVRCECLDKSGAILGYIENDSAAGELEDLAPGAPAGTGREKWLLDTMIKAQREALTWVTPAHERQMAAMSEILAANAHATRELVRLFEVQRDVASDIAHMKAVAESGDDMDKIVKMLEASPKLLQVLGPIVMGLRGGKAKPKLAAQANGEKGEKTS